MHLRDEVEALARQWGQPRIVEEQIPVAPGLSEKTVRDFFSDRWGEVVMVIHRAVDGRVWVMTKESFPQGLYSLPTGGIRHGEAILGALRRELWEETGFGASYIQRFLAVMRYTPLPAPGDPQDVPTFVSYAFLIEEMSGDAPVVSGAERILDFKTVASDELLGIARQWNRLSGLGKEFHDLAAWGRFRGIVHQVVWESLADERGRDVEGRVRSAAPNTPAPAR
jgi:8-oxo-dGTP diphosphatase